VLARAREAGVTGIVAVGVDYESNNRVLEMAGAYPSFVFPALGCHPQNLGETERDIEQNLRFIEDNIGQAVAVGEIGLDYHKQVRARADKDLQARVLREVLEIARRYGRPVSVHSRYSWRDCLAIIRESGVSRAVFHWYSGPTSVLNDLHEAWFHVSATPAVEYGAEHTRAIELTPLDRLMLETDTPVVYHRDTERARSAEPADAARVLKVVAEIKAIKPGDVARMTTRNAIDFFGLESRGIDIDG